MINICKLGLPMFKLPLPFNGTPEEHVRSDEHLEINHFNRLTCLYMLYVGEYHNFRYLHRCKLNYEFTI